MITQKAHGILNKYITNKNLIKHAVAVSAVMRHFAGLEGEDEEYWASVGLLHDIDWELYPDKHCVKCVEILKAESVDENFIRSVCSHGYEICCDVEPKHYMEKVLFAIDELTGLITACALVRPEKKLEFVEIETVKKKWGKKDFAAGANREIIERGAARMGKDLDYVIEQTLIAMKNAAAELGL